MWYTDSLQTLKRNQVEIASEGLARRLAFFQSRRRTRRIAFYPKPRVTTCGPVAWLGHLSTCRGRMAPEPLLSWWQHGGACWSAFSAVCSLVVITHNRKNRLDYDRAVCVSELSERRFQKELGMESSHSCSWLCLCVFLLLLVEIYY